MKKPTERQIRKCEKTALAQMNEQGAVIGMFYYSMGLDGEVFDGTFSGVFPYRGNTIL